MGKILFFVISLLFVFASNVGDASAVPDIRGRYSGSYTIVVSGCTDSSSNGTYDAILAINIPTQTGNAFDGTATGTFERDGSTAVENIQLSGTITESGQLSGNTSHTFLGTGGQGTFTGQLSGESLTIENPGHDTYGETCSFIRYMTATRVKISKLKSTFDTGSEGWSLYGDATNFTYHPNGGNLGGYISAVDEALGETWFFLAPDSWAGNWRSFLGGTISFDLKLITGNPNSYYSTVDVIIDTDGSGHYASWSSGIDPALGSWTHYKVRISESNFEVVGERTWDQIISNVEHLLIRGEHISGQDSEGIDNIRVVIGPGFMTPQMQLLLFDN